MTISAVTEPRVVYTGSGTSGPFAVSRDGTAITFDSNSHIKVTRFASATAVTGTLLVENTDYTLTGGPDNGSITLISPQTALLSSERLVIERVQPKSQGLNLTTGGSFDSSDIEARLDRLTEMVAEASGRGDRAFKIHFSDSAMQMLPPKSELAGNVLGFDASTGEPVVGTLDGVASIVTSLAEIAIVAAADADIATLAASISALQTVADAVDDGSIATVVAAIATDAIEALGGLTPAANKIPMFSGADTASLLTFVDEDNMASDSATSVPSQQSVKAYVDATFLYVDTVADLKALGSSLLASGKTIKTKGYHAAADGGGATYTYTSGGAGSGNDMTIIDTTDAGGHFDMVLDGKRVSLAAFGGRSSGNAAHATANRTAWQTAIDLEIPHFIPKGTGNYIIDAPEALTSSGTHAQSGAVVVDVPFDCEFERGAVVGLADDQYTHIMQVIDGADDFRLKNAKFDHNYASNFLAASCTISNISQTHLINQASPVCFNGGSKIKIKDFECEDSVYGAIQTNPYTQIDLIDIDGLVADGCLAGLICNGDVTTSGRYVRQMSVRGFKAKDTITEAMDINRGVYELTLHEPNCVNCYTFADHGEFHKEVIDIQDCVRVNVNNPVMDLNRQSGTGLRIKASNDTREISVTSPNIANAKLVTKQNMISTATGDWTVETGVGISGGVLTWTGTSGDVDAQQTQNTALGVAYDLGTSDSETTKAFIVEVPVTVTSGTLFVSLGTGSNLTNSSYRSIAITASGRYSFVVFGDDGDTITFRGATFTGSVDLSKVNVQENVGALIVIQNTQNVTITNPLLRSGSNAIQIYDLGNDTCDNISIDGGIIDSMVLDGVSIACHSNINSGVQKVTNLNISDLSMKSIGRYEYDIGRVEGGVISGGRLERGTDVEMRFHAGCTDILVHGVNGKNGSNGIALDVDKNGIDTEEVEILHCPGFVSSLSGVDTGTTSGSGKAVVSRGACSYAAVDATEAAAVYGGYAIIIGATFTASGNNPLNAGLDTTNSVANSDIRYLLTDETGAACSSKAYTVRWWFEGPTKFPVP
ncbi:MAG TPA: hypothetical protein DDZ20_06935 [Hyphomonas sp.]|nr:MAG: hypothetical protein GOVbin52_21 [Prokaryotic dsDNA virus sp.]HBJ40487.1 hypothetical protein [Hyphomonas sp.]|tara:strand:+ start:43031 stop:46174 length:3144 start_codon:yes stop_codon:yes gene_type:complete